VTLSEWEKVSYQRESPRMCAGEGSWTATPIAPANMAPIFAASGQERSVDLPGQK